MANVIIDVAAEFTGRKAFDQAGKATTGLEKNVKKLASALGLAFSTRAVVNFAKQSVKAFAEDDAAITVLRQNLKNLGLAYQSVNAENFIGKLEEQTGILDDQLRPAYAQLSKVTLSTTKTQELMALAVDLARSNGLELSTVITTLSRAYVGNNRGLRTLNTGLTDAELATKNFAEIQAILIKQSSGAGKAYIDTFAGSIDKLAVASANAKEVIGEGLVDLFADIAGNGDINQATDNVNLFAKAVSNLLKDVDKLTALDYLGVFLTGSITQETFDKLDQRPRARRFFTGGSGVSTEILAERKAAAAAAARAKKEKAAAAALAAAKIKADKLAAANAKKLSKAQSIFDIDRIQIAAALKGKISEEEKIRLNLMQAILDEDAKKAEDLEKKLEDIQKKNAEIAETLAKIPAANNPFAAWESTLNDVASRLAAIDQIKLGAKLIEIQTRESGYTVPIPVVISQSPNIFSPTDTPSVIADKATNAAADAAAAASAAAASVIESQAVVEALAQAATNGIPAISGTGSSSIFNPYAVTPGSSAGFGTQAPPMTLNLTVEGSILTENDFVDLVNKAVITADTYGFNQYRPGSVRVFE
jgi:hypothetical protein